MLEWMNVWALIQRKNRESLTSVQDHHMLVWLVQVEQKAAWLLQIAPLLCSVLTQVGPAKQQKKVQNFKVWIEKLSKRRVLHRDLNQQQSPENFSNKIRQFRIELILKMNFLTHRSRTHHPLLPTSNWAHVLPRSPYPRFSQHRVPINPPKLPQHPSKTTFTQHKLSQPSKTEQRQKTLPKHQPKITAFPTQRPQ